MQFFRRICWSHVESFPAVIQLKFRHYKKNEERSTSIDRFELHSGNEYANALSELNICLTRQRSALVAANDRWHDEANMIDKTSARRVLEHGMSPTGG